MSLVAAFHQRNSTRLVQWFLLLLLCTRQTVRSIRSYLFIDFCHQARTDSTACSQNQPKERTGIDSSFEQNFTDRLP